MENQTENQTENNNNTVIINNAEPEQGVIIEGNKEKLPKFVLPRGERLYLSREQISELNQSFFETLSDLKAGAEQASPELKSLMDSVVYLAYGEEIDRLRLKNKRECEVERQRQIKVNTALTPCTWRNWWWIFKKHRNQAQILLDERVRREAVIELQNQEDTLPEISDNGGEDGEEEQVPFTVAIQMLVEELPRMRKKRRVILNELIDQLYEAYNKKAEESKRLLSELEQSQRRATEAEEKARAAEETLEEFLNESAPAPVEEPAEEQKATAEAAETEQTEEAAPEEEQVEGEAESEPADEEEEDGLSYDGLDEEEWQE